MTRQEIKARAKAQLGGQIFSNNWLMALLVCLIVSAILSAISFTAIGTFLLLGPLSFGSCFIFISLARGKQNIAIEDTFKGFQHDFTGNLLLGLMQTLFTILWSMLFVIPGIVKSYSYSMAFYVKVDHPEYDWNACLKESMRIMKGNKGKLFVQDLSFIGWYIVGSLCLGIGALWVAPYVSAAKANFYESIRFTPVAQPAQQAAAQQ